MIFRCPRPPRWWAFVTWETEREAAVAPAALSTQPLPAGGASFLDALAGATLDAVTPLDRARIRRQLDRALSAKRYPVPTDPHGWRMPDRNRMRSARISRIESDKATERAALVWNRLHPRSPMRMDDGGQPASDDGGQPPDDGGDDGGL